MEWCRDVSENQASRSRKTLGKTREILRSDADNFSSSLQEFRRFRSSHSHPQSEFPWSTRKRENRNREENKNGSGQTSEKGRGAQYPFVIGVTSARDAQSPDSTMYAQKRTVAHVMFTDMGALRFSLLVSDIQNRLFCYS